jgi:PAS domain S-box-containing protein
MGKKHLNQDLASLQELSDRLARVLEQTAPDENAAIRVELEQLLTENRRQRVLLDAIFEADPSGLAVLVGPELRIAFANPAYRYICPPVEGEITGQCYANLWSEDPGGGYREQIEQVIRTGRPFQIAHFTRPYPDGAVRIFTLQARRIDWSGQPAALLILWDTTEAHRAEQATLDSERRVSTVLASIADNCYMLDREWRITRINDPALATFQKTREEVLGRSFWEVFPEARGTIIEENYLAATRDQAPVHYEVISPITGFWVEVNAYPSSEGMFVIFRDISRRRQDEEQLKRLLAQVETQATEVNTVFDALAGAVILLDAQGITLRANQPAIQILGFDPSGLDRDTVIRRLALHHPGGAPYREEEMPSFHALKGETVSGVKAGYTQPDGEERIIPISASPVFNSGHRLTGIVLAWQDITELERAGAILTRYQVLFEQTRDILLFVRLSDSRIVEANRAAVEAYGYTREELLQRCIEDLRAPETRGQIGHQMAEANSGGILFETRHRRKDGSTFPVEVSSRGADFDGQRANLSVVRDITERSHAEALVALSQTRQLLTTEAAGVGIWGIDLPALKIYCDEQVRQLLNFPEEIPVDLDYYRNLVHPDDWPQVEALSRWMTQTPQRLEAEFRVNLPGGSQRWLYVRGQCQFDRQGQPVQLLGVAMDITERKLAQEEIQASRDRIELQHLLIDQREQERLKIARDLHDGPLQDLTAMGLALEGILAATQDPAVRQDVGAIRDSLQNQLTDLRAYAYELRSPTLANFGLGKAIRSHLDAFQDKHPEIHIHFEETREGGLLPDEIRLALFRIYQESLANIAKHAHASEINVRLTKTNLQATLVIEDNGAGFALPRDWLELARQGHLGLVGIRERVEAIGGELDIQSAPGRGTTTRITVQIQPHMETASL